MDHLNRSKAGRKKAYKSAQALRKAVNNYFASISYVTVWKDENGNRVLNQNGEPIHYVKYAVPPTAEALSLYIGITDRTWRNYQQDETFAEVCEDAMTRIRAWRTQEASLRDKANGVIFLLQNDHNMVERKEINVPQAGSLSERMEILRRAADRMREMEGEHAGSAERTDEFAGREP